MSEITNLTKEEVVFMYRKAKFKTEQIHILAELTASDTDTILEILKDAGAFRGAYRTCPRCGKQYPVLQKRVKKDALCSECSKLRRRISMTKGNIKRNLARINELQRANVKHREELDRLEAEYENV
jgi:ssDNA-binding Zn-finger/Zn-ribbon topoisomerase 1